MRRLTSAAALTSLHQNGTEAVMAAAHRIRRHEASVARTVRFPARLRELVGMDAERCNRSFEAQVVAILRRHYGEDVDIAPSPASIIALARASFEGLTEADRRQVTRRLLDENDE